ncbi:MAG: NAD-dependent epimerase/dehydratase family protein [Planctomycetia bacterium]|nr:NAD-dependent epimerase/dehydratase family protein [Planctomycetia bacterium]
MTRRLETVVVPGGAGYVGAVLVPQLLAAGYRVRVLDLFIYGREALAAVGGHPRLELIEGDVRDPATVTETLRGADAVIHLACISNDPSVELDPDLSKSVNLDSFGPFVRAAKAAGVRRFIFASSGSVYGVSDSPQVTEDHPLVPVSLYNRYKAACEPLLFAEQSPAFTTVAVRPATICGYSPRQRLDLTVNILTNHAVNTGKITVFGGVQMRPNLHMQDMVDLYCLLLEVPDERIAGQIFNAGYQNFSVAETAEVIRKVVREELPGKGEIEIVTTPSDDIRSYRINSDKIQRVLGFVPRHTIEDGARDLIRAFQAGKLPDSMSDVRYSNIKTMKAVHLK